MIDWLTYDLPWWLPWGLASVPVLAVAWRFFGLRGALMAFLALFALSARHRGRQEGWEARGERQEERRQRIQEKFDEIDRKPLSVDDAYRHLRGLSDD